jgi:phosphoglucosamine mutase
MADEIVCGLRDTGVDTASAGVVPTPAIAYLTHTHGFSAGVVISASHNPWRDNGIKVFGPDGFKLPDAVELEIETEIFSLLNEGIPPGTAEPAGPSLPGDQTLRMDYLNWLARTIAGAERLHIVVDCANGAASTVAPEIFKRSGAHTELTHRTPDGRNINENCGALHPEIVAREVLARTADLGICFDGDADRALFADSNGRVVNGDAVMLLLARDLKQRGELTNDTVVATTMSNMGLEAALRESGIKMLRAPVGDKYVLEEMRKTGAVLGGEQSGHIILSREATTGDGLLTAIRVLGIVAASGRPLAELASGMKVFPQTIKNIRVKEKRPLDQLPEVMQAIEGAERELKGNGRVNVRYSGTESLARVMVEAETEEMVQRIAGQIAAALEAALGLGVSSAH